MSYQLSWVNVFSGKRFVIPILCIRRVYDYEELNLDQVKHMYMSDLET